MRSLLSLLLILLVAATVANYTAGQTRTARGLDIYVVDVEGGNATREIASARHTKRGISRLSPPCDSPWHS